ncbi:GDP-mannose 4,6-dehydratase, partial [Prochlorococcus sp. AH-716-E17]|nr:GDP-mannose 4,6-dehydratase [Prochlorococcus sp. AH-716-E17]
MKLLVIGSNSFSGSHFVSEALRNNHSVIGVSRSKEPKSLFLAYKWSNNQNSLKLLEKNFTFQSLDLNKDLDLLIKLVDEYEPEYVVNFASQGMVAESWLEPTHWYQTNLLSQVAFHDFLRKKKFLKKYVHISTPEVYGDTNGWIKENHNFNPTTPYSVSRAACDNHLLSFFKAYDFPVIFTRAANVYGPGQQLYRIIPRTILSIRTGKKLYLHGSGHSKRSFVHISDVVKATLKLTLEAEPGTCWHISTKEALSIRNLVQKICNIGNLNFDEIVKDVEERLGKDKNYFLDSSKIRKIYNWEDSIN